MADPVLRKAPDGRRRRTSPPQPAPAPAPAAGTVAADKPEARPQEAPALELALLNRHWYRRCLDWLDERLRRSPANPSIASLKELCDHVITDFLTAVTGQAPDSEQLQFPADRAYFIPIEGDLAESFNFAKPLYRFSGEGTGAEQAAYEDSIWSYYPWGEKFGDVRIDSAQSVDAAGRTVPFEEMISVRAQFTKEEKARAQGGEAHRPAFLLEKSLIVRGDHRGYLRDIAEDADAPTAILAGCQSSMQAIFTIHTLTPGNSAVESILLRHVTLIRWLMALLLPEEGGRESITEQDESFKELFGSFLCHFFLGTAFGKPAPVGSRQDIADLFPKSPEIREALGLEARAENADSDWQRLDRLAGKRGSLVGTWLSDRKKERPENKTPEEWRQECGEKLQADLVSFRKLFLSAGSEKRIEGDLAVALGPRLPKAGESSQSFVWVIPDFETIDLSLPPGFTIQEKATEEVHKLADSLADAYQAFFRQFDVACLKDSARLEVINAYWRTLGQANRPERIFSSFVDDRAGLVEKTRAPAQAAWDEAEPKVARQPGKARPQNFFLRVKICDSLNEPKLNGLFVISTDHDEVRFKGKPQKVRREDQEDLLAFAKVYFFIVRDYLRALDEAQSARDIGQLNQFLYDRRLGDLEERMQRRSEDPAFVEGGIARRDNWSLFTYELINNYGASLISKPENVQSETFPYDRLLVVPLPPEQPWSGVAGAAGMEKRGAGRYELPFYLFQTIFVERELGKIKGGHYSLIKPFQSPIEELEAAEATERFRVKSFQQVSRRGNEEDRLERYLEKLYVGGTETASSPAALRGGGARAGKDEEPAAGIPAGAAGSPEAESYVVKLATAQTLGSAGECHDRGSAWVAAAVDAFWSRFDTQTERHAGLWRGFLCDLTASFQGLRQVGAADPQSPEQLWFLLRFEVLRILLARRAEGDPILERIRRAYREDLKLRFDDDHALNLFDLARRSQLDPFAEIGKWLPVLSERQVVDIDFASFDLRQQDPFMLELFELLTDLVCNADVNWASTGKATWYQPLLTRPLESAEPGPASAATGDDGPAGLSLHRGAGRQVGKRVPPYDDIRSGKHSLSTFLGLVNFSVGQGKQTSRLRCLVALIRDYDDTQTGAGLSADEVKQQLEVDLQDLGLYTTTFFRNAQKFVADAMAREENRILSTDISQIARNWYSTGMDSLFARLGHRLDRILDNRNDFRLGSLRSEVVDEFFDGLLEIMLRPEERPSSEREQILLESFPFDRLLHVPLVLGDAEGARLCYARTQICDQLADAREDTFSWSRLSAQDCYEEIRKSGRIWPQRGGLKKSVDPVRHFGQVLVRDEGDPDPWEPSMPLAALIRLLARIGEPRALDVFVRSLYEANAIQTLAVAGLVLHLMKIGRDRLPVENYRRMHDRLEAVVQDSVRSVEQASGFAGGDGGSASGGVASAAYMDREAVLRPLSAVGTTTELLRSLGDTRCLPGWYELFSAAEAGSPDFTYGLRDRLGNAVQSKLFYVYYSLPAPRTFTEVPALGARFRGIFALIVDDSSTDVKNEVGEVADQQDIRTFIHNGVRSLGQVLDSQGLEGKLRQPGVESFVNGMLHRLKNELGKPLAVLQTLRETSSSHEIEKIDGAVATIKGIKDLFEGLRGLSEIQREVVPIRSFTTDWLGWLFLAKICVAAGKTADEINGSSGAAMAELHEIQRIGKKAEALLRADARDSWHVVDLIQRECQELEAVLQGLAAQAVKGGHRPAVILSFQVFSDEPLEFLGSFQLEEALNVLFENAFQAFWQFLTQTAVKSSEQPVYALKLVARRSDQRHDEVLLEISNSAKPIDPAVLSVLNNKVPQPMTSQQHAKRSGKSGGSGFGHYFARRIVADLCGGREARRDLDVRIDYLAKAGFAKIRMNLLSATSQGVRRVPPESLQAELWRNFEHRIPIPDGVDYTFCIPDNVDVKSLFNTVRRLLLADREGIENRLSAWWTAGVCGMLSARCGKVLKEIIARLQALSAGGARGQEMEACAQLERDARAKVRPSSFHDLRDFILRARDRQPQLLTLIAAKSELLRTTLGGVLGGGDLQAADLIEGSERQDIEQEFEQYRPRLRSRHRSVEPLVMLLQDLERDEYGIAVPARQRLEDLLCDAEWRIDSAAEDGALHLAVSLVDGDPTDMAIDMQRLRAERPQGPGFYAKYQFVGPTFHSYMRAFERDGIDDDKPLGRLWFEVQTAADSGVLGRTVHLALSLSEPAGALPGRDGNA